MSDNEDTQNDFELMEQQSKYIAPICSSDVIEKLGILQNIIENLFTVKGQLNDLVYEDAVIVDQHRNVFGHVIDIYGSFDDAVHYCCAKSLNCSESLWNTLVDAMKREQSVELYAVQSLSVKMDRLIIKEQQKEEEEDFTHQSDTESAKEDLETIIEDESEEGEIKKESYLSKYEELYNFLDVPKQRMDSRAATPIEEKQQNVDQVLTQLPGLMPVYTNK